MKKMMDAEGCKAFSNTFQDLYGMEQLPGLASQHLMAQGLSLIHISLPTTTGTW